MSTRRKTSEPNILRGLVILLARRLRLRNAMSHQQYTTRQSRRILALLIFFAFCCLAAIIAAHR